MAETYEAERKSAKADIEAAGCPCKVILRDTPSTFKRTAALFLDFNFVERLGGAVLDGDVKLMVPALGVFDPLDPEIYDILIDTTDARYVSANGQYQIVNPNPFLPGGIPIYYNIQARRR